MRALCYHGSHDVHVDLVPDPVLRDSDDIIVRVTATAIGGSDLHIYRGRTAGMERGDILGHAFTGVVEEAGAGVTRLRRGDRVVVPALVACGRCFFCALQQFAFCEAGLAATPNRRGIPPAAARFGQGRLYGGLPGGQADYVRVPHANTGPLRIPGDFADERVLFLGELLPAAYQAVLNTGVMPGDNVAIFGAGPLGLMAAACARLAGVERIFMVDHHDYRLAFAQESYGVFAINFDRVDDAAAVIVQETRGHGADAAIDAVGFEARGSMIDSALTALHLEAGNASVLRQCMAAVRRGGAVSVPGNYAGFIHGFPIGEAFEKGLAFRIGPTHVQRFLPKLLQFVERGDLKPELMVTHRLPLTQAAEGYRLFDEKKEDCRQVVLYP
jgi:threonine dehydrogenase-like Zn-dependent dehydrogenase